MLVKDIMQHDVACVRPETPLEEIVLLLQRRGVRHLAVLDHEELVGVISDRDLKSVLPGPLAKPAATATGSGSGGVRAGDIMTKRIITVEPMVSVEDAARLLVENRIGALPVTDDGGTLVGIVTETDVLLLFVRAMGILEPSSRLDVLLPDAPASLGRMVHTIESAGAAGLQHCHAREPQPAPPRGGGPRRDDQSRAGDQGARDRGLCPQEPKAAGLLAEGVGHGDNRHR